MFSRRRITPRKLSKQPAILTAALTLLAGPLVVIGGNAAVDLVQDNGSGVIDPSVQTVSLADSASVLVEDAAIATQSLADEEHPNRGVVKEITSDAEFSQFALTWTGSADVASFVRAQRADGTWSEWFSAEPQYPTDGQGNGLNGTELIYVEPTKKVQVSTLGLNVFGPDSGVNIEDIHGAEGLDLSKLNINLGDYSHDARPSLPNSEGDQTPASAAAEQAKQDALKVGREAASRLKSEVQVEGDAKDNSQDSDQGNNPTKAGSTAADGSDATAPSASAPSKWTDIVPVAEELPLDQVDAVLIDGNAAASAIDPIVDAKNTTGMPQVITRAGWGANENNRCQGPDYDDKLVAATVHHTAGSNNYSEAQAAGIVRGIYQYHAQTLGWCDIGYNALVDKFGNIYEGRYGGLDKNVQGAHAGGFNQGTFGISMMGDYSTVQPSQAALNAVGNMIGWRLKVAGVNPNGKTSMTSGGTHYSKYGYGQNVTLPNIFAHRDVGNTTCPGNAGYAQMPTIRAIAEKKYAALSSGKVNNEAADGDTSLVATPTTSHSGSTTSSSTSSASSTSSTSSSSSSTASSSSASSTSSSSAKATKPTTSTSASKTAEPTTSPSASATATSTPAPAKPSEPTETGSSADSANHTAAPSNSTATPEASTGARSMLASALGVMGAPGLGATADAILESVGRSIDNGPSIADLPVLAGKILAISQSNDLAKEWQTVTAKFGSVLGNALSGIQTGSTVANTSGIADTLRYVKFDNGVITSSKTTGTHALWGEIADAWAQQGFEVGKLGAPTSSQTVEGAIERAEFQNGTITLDRNTGEVTTQMK